MILAVDVDYRNPEACAAGIAFDDWTDDCESGAYQTVVYGFEAYIPGAFYRRELPCILSLLEDHKLVPDIIVIDGFVKLDRKNRYGLGMHLYEALPARIPIIGVAKNPFKGLGKECEIYRGKSKKPLYVTCVGIDIEKAKDNILSMHGKYRMPNLLKRVDQLCKQG